MLELVMLELSGKPHRAVVNRDLLLRNRVELYYLVILVSRFGFWV
jgi:hypothetical protein